MRPTIVLCAVLASVLMALLPGCGSSKAVRQARLSPPDSAKNVVPPKSAAVLSTIIRAAEPKKEGFATQSDTIDAQVVSRKNREEKQSTMSTAPVRESKAQRQGKQSNSSLLQSRQSMEFYERSFKPSVYELDPSEVYLYHFETAAPETVQGFRVQLLTTNEYDEAAALRNILENEFPDKWIYTIYDAPTYKVRMGDYLTRGDAAMMLDSVMTKEIKGAWIVPDHIIKNPPPKPPRPVVPDSTASIVR